MHQKPVGLRRPPLNCCNCPLRDLASIIPVSSSQVTAIDRARGGVRCYRPHAPIYFEGDAGGELLTLFSGWAFSYQMLADGRRQIFRFILPGDLAGVQPDFTGPMDHGVETITDVAVCVFGRDALRALLGHEPELGWQFTWLLAQDQVLLRQHLTTIGRRPVIERLGCLLLELHHRLKRREMHDGDSCPFPLTQTHIGDALGLASAHVSRLLRRLREDGLVTVKGGRLWVHDLERLTAMSQFEDSAPTRRPVL